MVGNCGHRSVGPGLQKVMGRSGRLWAAAALATFASFVLMGCGGSNLKHATVCNSYPNGTFKPAGCQNHLHGETLNIITPTASPPQPTGDQEGASCRTAGGDDGMIVVEGSNGPVPGQANCVPLDGP